MIPGLIPALSTKEVCAPRTDESPIPNAAFLDFLRNGEGDPETPIETIDVESNAAEGKGVELDPEGEISEDPALQNDIDSSDIPPSFEDLQNAADPSFAPMPAHGKDPGSTQQPAIEETEKGLIMPARSALDDLSVVPEDAPSDVLEPAKVVSSSGKSVLANGETGITAEAGVPNRIKVDVDRDAFSTIPATTGSEARLSVRTSANESRQIDTPPPEGNPHLARSEATKADRPEITLTPLSERAIRENPTQVETGMARAAAGQGQPKDSASDTGLAAIRSIVERDRAVLQDRPSTLPPSASPERQIHATSIDMVEKPRGHSLPSMMPEPSARAQTGVLAPDERVIRTDAMIASATVPAMPSGIAPNGAKPDTAIRVSDSFPKEAKPNSADLVTPRKNRELSSETSAHPRPHASAPVLSPGEWVVWQRQHTPTRQSTAGFGGTVKTSDDPAAIPSERRETAMGETHFSVSSSPTTITAANANTIAATRPALQQLTETAVQLKSGQTEIALSPEELGRVSIRMTQTETGVMVLLTVERDDTQNLLRKHASDLSDALRAAGLGEAQIDFSDRREERGTGASDLTGSESRYETERDPADTGDPTPPLGSRATNDRIDIRL